MRRSEVTLALSTFHWCHLSTTSLQHPFFSAQKLQLTVQNRSIEVVNNDLVLPITSLPSHSVCIALLELGYTSPNINCYSPSLPNFGQVSCMVPRPITSPVREGVLRRSRSWPRIPMFLEVTLRNASLQRRSKMIDERLSSRRRLLLLYCIPQRRPTLSDASARCVFLLLQHFFWDAELSRSELPHTGFQSTITMKNSTNQIPRSQLQPAAAPSSSTVTMQPETDEELLFSIRQLYLDYFDEYVFNRLPTYLIRISDMKLVSRSEIWECVRPLVKPSNRTLEEARRMAEQHDVRQDALKLHCSVAYSLPGISAY
ncbi:hypothetical protein BDN67DRAFT_791753 [Paxillus ammoniavirescens]|nr:hypothetical protein BDN67DRAFT_791753 [Paxillus ammoniavirescens]